MYFVLTDVQLRKPPVSYRVFMTAAVFSTTIATMKSVMNNDLANYLRRNRNIIDCYAEPYQVTDPWGTRRKHCKYDAALLACAKKTHLMYFIYLVDHKSQQSPVIRAPFIVFEGPDFCGKSTQVKYAINALHEMGLWDNHPVAVKAPAGPLRDYLLGDENKDAPVISRALVNIASMKEMDVTTVIPALANNTPVVGDRWVYTTYAYEGEGRGLDHQVIEGVVRSIDLSKPDLVIILKNKDATLECRKELRKGELNHLDLLPPDVVARIRNAYHAEFNNFFSTKIMTISGEGTAEQVSMRVHKALTTFLTTNKG